MSNSVLRSVLRKVHVVMFLFVDSLVAATSRIHEVFMNLVFVISPARRLIFVLV